jgi:exosortase
MSNREPTTRGNWPAWSCVPLVAALFWAYWPAIEQMARRWSQDPQYTHGYVVPVFAAVVLWFRRDRFPGVSSCGSWWGVPLLLLAGVLRMSGALFSLEPIEVGSLVPALAGVLMLTLGARVVLWCWPGAVFLLFILPWPFQIDVLLTYPLRRVATICSTYALQTMGIPALARGNIIVINNELPIGVVEACSGLGMLMTFFALSTAVALVIRRPLVDRLLLFASAVPIGVLMNVVRITLTVFLIRVVDAEVANVVFHDVAGWVMMPAALVVLWLEMLWLGRLRLPVERERAGPIAVYSVPPPAEMPGWLRRHEADSGADMRKTTRPHDTSVEHRVAPSGTTPRTPEVTTPTPADGPLQEIPDVAC